MAPTLRSCCKQQGPSTLPEAAGLQEPYSAADKLAPEWAAVLRDLPSGGAASAVQAALSQLQLLPTGNASVATIQVAAPQPGFALLGANKPSLVPCACEVHDQACAPSGLVQMRRNSGPPRHAQNSASGGS